MLSPVQYGNSLAADASSLRIWTLFIPWPAGCAAGEAHSLAGSNCSGGCYMSGLVEDNIAEEKDGLSGLMEDGLLKDIP